LKFPWKQKSFFSGKGDNNTHVDIDGRLYTAQELSAMTLQKKTAEDYLGSTVTEAYYCSCLL
jgi:molecular chaperone DnaK